MELCIKTITGSTVGSANYSFNPCFNGTMYKNRKIQSSINSFALVSILVLMELCIKTEYHIAHLQYLFRFNPCFNGTMYKNIPDDAIQYMNSCFNPCFNGTMYKNGLENERNKAVKSVSILVLMELCIKTILSL